MDKHVADIDLVLHLDKELSPLQAVRVRWHLKRCNACRERRDQLRQAMAGFSEAVRRKEVRAEEEGRARLREGMRQLPALPSRQPHMARITAAVAIGLALLGATLALRTRKAERAGLSMPNPILTPGVAAPVSRDMVCSASEADETRIISTALAITVFNHYGISNPRSRAYEVDYLITPALGGAEDVRNLWPQPYASGVWNSRVKDALEDRLRTMVCEGRMDLSAAQGELARDWIAAYKKLFETEEPLPEHHAFVKDPAWE